MKYVVHQHAPDKVINTAAYVRVDENPDKAFLVNALRARNVAVFGGEADMGQPVKILDLKLPGLKEGEDVEIKYIGLRPGEKLFEGIFTEKERIVATRDDKNLLAKSEDVDKEKLLRGIAELERLALRRDGQGIKRKLKELVPSCQPEGME